jgi:radical SAM protein (TIGR01212 family)
MLEHGLSIDEQIDRGRRFAETRYGARKYIAYFQSFTNTYGPLSVLKALYDEALGHPGVVGLSVGTRPDCVNKPVMELLASYQKNHLVWLEYGLQSAHDLTLARIHRGHDVASFANAVQLAHDHGLKICAHVILGLPGETREMMLQTARFLGESSVAGVKIHLLYVARDTPLADLYRKGGVRCLERDVYVDLVVDFLELLPPDMVIQRLTGDPTESQLLAPLWAMEKSKNISLIRNRLVERDTWQGKLYG